MLLVVSLGLSVVRDELGRTMRKCQLLAGAHFIFGGTLRFISASQDKAIDILRFLVLYAVGIVELEFESTSALVLLMFVIPLAFTLSGFLMWILYSLNGMHSPDISRDSCWCLNGFQRRYPNSRPGNSITNFACSNACITFFCSLW